MMALLVLAVLYVSSGYSYLLFHSLAEVFAVIIACGIFMVAWNSRKFLDNQYLLFIGIAYLFVGLLDLMHMLTYKGMQVLPGFNANTPTQLWIAARYLQSFSLLTAPLMFRRRLHPFLLVIAYGVATGLLLLSIMLWRNFPDCFLPGTGLTPFKICSEYVICLALSASGALIFKYRREFDPAVLRWLLASVLLTILSELAFTSYVSVYGPANLIGHYLKIVAFYCIYKAIIETGLTKPYELLFRNLKQAKERYRALFTHMIDGFATHEVIFDAADQPVDYRFLEVNPAFEALTGLHDVVGKCVTSVIPGIEKEPADWIGAYGAVATTGKSLRIESYSEQLDRWYAVAAYCPVPGQFATVFEDISERRQAQERERRQREWLRVTLDSIGDAVIATDEAGRISFINSVAAGLTGWPIAEALGRPIGEVFRIVNEGTGEPVEDLVHRVISQKTVISLANHTALITRDGRKVPIADSAAPIREDGGRIIGVVLVFYDVTDRRRASEALRASEARFKLLSDIASRLLGAANPQALVNELCREVMGYLACQVFLNYLVEPSGRKLRLNAFDGITDDQARAVEWLDFGSGVSGCAARDRRRIVIEENLQNSDPRTEFITSFGELQCEISKEYPILIRKFASLPYVHA